MLDINREINSTSRPTLKMPHRTITTEPRAEYGVQARAPNEPRNQECFEPRERVTRKSRQGLRALFSCTQQRRACRTHLRARSLGVCGGQGWLIPLQSETDLGDVGRPFALEGVRAQVQRRQRGVLLQSFCEHLSQPSTPTNRPTTSRHQETNTRKNVPEEEGTRNSAVEHRVEDRVASVAVRHRRAGCFR